MFVIAVVLIVATVVMITIAVMQTQLKGDGFSLERHPEQVLVPLAAGAVTLLIIIGGTLFKVYDLRGGGGTAVAESLGGRRIYPNTSDRVERRLLNVVEEMAIASGTPVPPVFMLPEEGINAFAAGYSPSDAVLGVTRGCATQLTRDELQGVIAHEFSHVLNGDMRMSIKLIGVLHGLLLIGLTGQLIFRMFLYSGGGHRRSNSNSSGNNSGGGGQIILVIIAVGVALLILGFIGTFFGNLIKAAVSRQREYLADASAVQFTRNPSGIADALKRIGGYKTGSRLKAPKAAEVSHMYFAQGVWEGISGLWATHPPLEKRIKAIEPRWNGKMLGQAAKQDFKLDSRSAGFAGGTAAATGGKSDVPLDIVDHAVDHVGEPNEQHRHYAAELLGSLPAVILDNVHEPYAARAIVYCLLLDANPEIRKNQLESLQRNATPDVVALVVRLAPQVDRLDIRARLPLIDLALPSLRAMCEAQYKEFKHCFVELSRADRKIDLFEWMLSQVLMRHLQPQFERVPSLTVQYYSLLKLSAPLSLLLSSVAAAGNSADVAKRSFETGASHLPDVNLTHQAAARSLDELRDALKILSTVSAKHRGRIVDACAAAICADDHVTWQEAELLRGISDLLDCPMPPLLVSSN
ncbi:MAG: M48 family metallopeptidase [Aureliella sp.]